MADYQIQEPSVMQERREHILAVNLRRNFLYPCAKTTLCSSVDVLCKLSHQQLRGELDVESMLTRHVVDENKTPTARRAQTACESDYAKCLSAVSVRSHPYAYWTTLCDA